MEDNVITWKPCYKVGGLVVYVTRYGDVMTIDSFGRLVYKKQFTLNLSPSSIRHRMKSKGYQCVKIGTNENITIHFLVHRLVAGVYCQCPNIFCTEVDHLDGNPKNNRWDNLEWVTRSENIQRRIKMKTLQGKQ